MSPSLGKPLRTSTSTQHSVGFQDDQDRPLGMTGNSLKNSTTGIKLKRRKGVTIAEGLYYTMLCQKLHIITLVSYLVVTTIT